MHRGHTEVLHLCHQHMTPTHAHSDRVGLLFWHSFNTHREMAPDCAMRNEPCVMNGTCPNGVCGFTSVFQSMSSSSLTICMMSQQLQGYEHR